MVSQKLPPGFNLVLLKSVESTNDEARRRAEDGAPEGTLIQARTQTGGRGRRGRSWESPVGNLYMSLILRPDCPAAAGLGLSFVSAIAMCDTIGSVMPPMVTVTAKWPNDILINGRKVAGILLESASGTAGKLRWLVVGVGVNIEQFPTNTQYPATSLYFEGATNIEPAEVLGGFTRYFKRWFDIWKDEGFSPIRNAWLQRAAGLGEMLEIRLPDEMFVGRFLDIDESGSLLVELENGDIRSVTTGDVFPQELQ